ncbi:hypothetical protein AVEN_5854-1 [Araneus ventricosus]|uniref:Uncharacterized protein n=1 Tax=Araneus ventricosus TaxID=182803 RepID=A0A4Y2KVF3_ARAVE|nr:hypothetical protein AVEN_5854-1 [Araneus ventricosus]
MKIVKIERTHFPQRLYVNSITFNQKSGERSPGPFKVVKDQKLKSLCKWYRRETTQPIPSQFTFRPVRPGDRFSENAILLKMEIRISPFFSEEKIMSAALGTWQDNWDSGETGRSTHDIVPRVSNKPVGWHREEIMFVTGHGPFPSYRHRFNLRTHDNCSSGGKGDPQNVGLPSPVISKLQ